MNLQTIRGSLKFILANVVAVCGTRHWLNTVHITVAMDTGDDSNCATVMHAPVIPFKPQLGR